MDKPDYSPIEPVFFRIAKTTGDRLEVQSNHPSELY